jgi:hypothetical protein
MVSMSPSRVSDFIELLVPDLLQRHSPLEELRKNNFLPIVMISQALTLESVVGENINKTQ